jgi:hypothetical protein
VLKLALLSPPMPKNEALDICDKDHSAVLPAIEELDFSQAPSRGRHHCAGCAYEEGFAAGWKAAGGKGQPPMPPKVI